MDSLVDWAQARLGRAAAEAEAVQESVAEWVRLGLPYAGIGAAFMRLCRWGNADGSPFVFDVLHPVTGKNVTLRSPLDETSALGAAIGWMDYLRPEGGYPDEPADRSGREIAILKEWRRQQAALGDSETP